jgi:hypothetical protein
MVHHFLIIQTMKLYLYDIDETKYKTCNEPTKLYSKLDGFCFYISESNSTMKLALDKWGTWEKMVNEWKIPVWDCLSYFGEHDLVDCAKWVIEYCEKNNIEIQSQFDKMILNTIRFSSTQLFEKYHSSFLKKKITTSSARILLKWIARTGNTRIYSLLYDHIPFLDEHIMTCIYKSAIDYHHPEIITEFDEYIDYELYSNLISYCKENSPERTKLALRKRQKFSK